MRENSVSRHYEAEIEGPLKSFGQSQLYRTEKIKGSPWKCMLMHNGSPLCRETLVSETVDMSFSILGKTAFFFFNELWKANFPVSFVCLPHALLKKRLF